MKCIPTTRSGLSVTETMLRYLSQLFHRLRYRQLPRIPANSGDTSTFLVPFSNALSVDHQDAESERREVLMSTSGDEVVRRFHGDRISRRYPGVKGYFVGAEYGQSQEHCITDKRTIHRHRLDLVPKQAHNQMANGRFPAIKLEA